MIRLRARAPVPPLLSIAVSYRRAQTNAGQTFRQTRAQITAIAPVGLEKRQID
ncbi:hypothetical protein [Tychonema sp. BBK16]|uniref:hypothetical protein n=1 Tax=Tychonema sp. BBK16 TaxID=2699888 RepID=UPI001F2913C4|nr:hypothetical protein [Tychonema sp. BBK16]MCF6373143.1 hypothetical protein [Tychonema sp. BBK16]